MIIKKYKANTENKAILMAKDDLGKDAIVMNIKTVKPKGMFKLFRKTLVEVTAAVDENPPKDNLNKASLNKNNISSNSSTPNAKTENQSIDIGVDDDYLKQFSNNEKNSSIEEKLNSLTKLLEEQVYSKENIIKNKSQQNVSANMEQESHTITKDEENKSNSNKTKTEESKVVDLIFEQLVNNEVTMEYAKEILDEVDVRSKRSSINDLLASVYQRIILKLGLSNKITLGKDKPKVVFFIGPTGVGKTTTIAKLASKFKLEDKASIAIITCDTYRIAAVEQIKTYANILTIPVEVVYEAKDINTAIEKFKNYDLVFVDTAGRSHKNEEQFNDAKVLLDSVDNYDSDIYLVVSATTKYNDLIKITDAYSTITRYSIIFTKLDETTSYGNLLNIKMRTGEALSYVAWGQNVPDDIGELNPQIIAKQLLGGNE